MRNKMFNEHTLDIVKAALPHVNRQAQSGMNMLLKVSDLMDTVEEVTSPSELSAMGIGEEESLDPEELLVSIKEVCLPGEVEIVDMILNVINAQKIYRAYQNYGSEVLQSEELGDGLGENPFGISGRGPLMDMLMSQLSPEQRSTFEMINMMMSSMNVEPSTAEA